MLVTKVKVYNECKVSENLVSLYDFAAINGRVYLKD